MSKASKFQVAAKRKASAVWQWCKEHPWKTAFIVITVVGIPVLYVVTKDKIVVKQVLKNSDAAQKLTTETATEALPATLPVEVLEQLTGNRQTARALGDIVGESAQQITKRLIAAGLAERTPNGDVVSTALGKPLCELTWKTTYAGHNFTNLEWDDSVLQLIFSPEELAAKASRSPQG